MKRIIFTILCFLLVTFAFGQTSKIIEPFDQCGYRTGVNEMESLYPGYKQQIDKVLQTAKEEGKLHRGGEVYKVKVVVHVVWKQAKENLDDSIILNQMEILNQDFRRLNPDADNVRDIYNDIVGDAEIEFELDRIIRVQTTKTFKPTAVSITAVDNVKKTSKGGSDAIDPDHYLNIWVVNIQPITLGSLTLGYILGYAYPPADLPNWPAGNSAPEPALDGVVIDYRFFGNNNPNTLPAPYNTLFISEGRTPVHEVGHYLGLRHIWADKSDPLTGAPNCNGEDDGADDTPFCGSNAQLEGCDPTKNTCNKNQPGDLPDMWENYMDYSREECQVAFTNDQIAIMRGVLEGPRATLLETATGITNVQLQKQVLVFPNPSNGTIVVKAKEAPNTIEIYDMLGKLVYTNHAPTTNNQITLDVAKGVYLVKSTYNEGIATSSIVVE
ncbi:MAG: zinc-dependent metalloprotease [Chitinophagales bacterium]|nr:zinc-dependent metalloprotease [Chitinophagales bacterium]